VKPSDRYRWAAVVLLVVAATLSAYANHHHQRGLEALAYACFLGAVFAVLAWRRAHRARRGDGSRSD
jgi:Na+/proline symporter